MDRGFSGEKGRRTQDSPNKIYNSDRIVIPQRLITVLGIEQALRVAEQMNANQIIRNMELRHGDNALPPIP